MKSDCVDKSTVSGVQLTFELQRPTDTEDGAGVRVLRVINNLM